MTKDEIKRLGAWVSGFDVKADAEEELAVSHQTFHNLMLKLKAAAVTGKFTAHPNTITKIRAKIGQAA